MAKYHKQFKSLLTLLASIWLVFALSHVFPLNSYGIIPRATYGLWGILFSPFLHLNFSHILNNSILLFTFGIFYIIFVGRSFLRLIFILSIFGGIGTWFIGANGVHIGASGLVFGLWAHLLFIGYFQRRLKFILISAIVLIFYSSLFFGLFPSAGHISWEGHFCSAVAGFFTAKYPSSTTAIRSP